MQPNNTYSSRPQLSPEHLKTFPLLTALCASLANMPALAIAYSGGLDSRFLAHVALGIQHKRMHLFHITGPHIPEEETRAVTLQAETQQLPLTLVSINPLDNTKVKNNGTDRCYHCKYTLFSTLADMVKAHPAFAGIIPILCDGTNTDDLISYRPGLMALKELGVRSPLAEVGFGKKDIRNIGAAIGFANPQQRARPCLLTRFAYNLEPTEECLKAVDTVESRIAKILQGDDFHADFRLRLIAQPKLKRDLQYTASFTHATEVHVTAELSEKIQSQIAKIVIKAGFLPPKIICMESVQGWFDKKD